MSWPVVLLISLLVQDPAAAPAQAEGQSPAPAAQPPRDTQQSKPATTTPDTAAADSQSASGFSVSSVVSVDRIRRELERQPRLSFVTVAPNSPRFRLEIQANRFQLPAQFAVPRNTAPAPLGGTDYYDVQRLNTPPEYWGSAPFSNGDLLKMSALSGAYGLLGALIKKGIESRASVAESRAHQEVQQELADLAEHNARIRSGQSDGQPPATPNTDKDKKKKKKGEGGDQK